MRPQPEDLHYLHQPPAPASNTYSTQTACLCIIDRDIQLPLCLFVHADQLSVLNTTNKKLRHSFAARGHIKHALLKLPTQPCAACIYVCIRQIYKKPPSQQPQPNSSRSHSCGSPCKLAMQNRARRSSFLAPSSLGTTCPLRGTLAI